MLFPRNPRAKNGYDSGVVDVAFQLFSCGMVWDGNITCKSGRDHLLRHGYAVRHDGMTTLTGKGTVSFLLHSETWKSAYRRWRLWRRNPFIASPERVKGAMR